MGFGSRLRRLTRRVVRGSAGIPTRTAVRQSVAPRSLRDTVAIPESSVRRTNEYMRDPLQVRQDPSNAYDVLRLGGPTQTDVDREAAARRRRAQEQEAERETTRNNANTARTNAQNASLAVSREIMNKSLPAWAAHLFAGQIGNATTPRGTATNPPPTPPIIPHPQQSTGGTRPPPRLTPTNPDGTKPPPGRVIAPPPGKPPISAGPVAPTRPIIPTKPPVGGVIELPSTPRPTTPTVPVPPRVVQPVNRPPALPPGSTRLPSGALIPRVDTPRTRPGGDDLTGGKPPVIIAGDTPPIMGPGRNTGIVPPHLGGSPSPLPPMQGGVPIAPPPGKPPMTPPVMGGGMSVGGTGGIPPIKGGGAGETPPIYGGNMPPMPGRNLPPGGGEPQMPIKFTAGLGDTSGQMPPMRPGTPTGEVANALLQAIPPTKPPVKPPVVANTPPVTIKYPPKFFGMDELL